MLCGLKAPLAAAFALLLAVTPFALRGESAPAGPWTVPVLVLRYFPVTADGQNIDELVTGNVGGSLAAMKEKCDRMTQETAAALEEGSRFRAYKNPEAKPSLKYEILETIDYLEPVPHSAVKTGKADYIQILERAKLA